MGEGKTIDFMEELDVLTGLGNGKYMEQRLEECREPGWFWTVDLDNFHEIQREKGILFGDEVICDIARMLCRIFSKDAVIIRNIEDEFFVFHYAKGSEEEEGILAEQVKEAVHCLYEGDWINCEVRASFGIAAAEPGESLEALSSRAQKALGWVKEQGGDGWAFYREEYQNRHEVRASDPNRRPELFEMLPRENATEYNFRFLSDTKDAQAAINMLMKRLPEFYGADHCLLFLAEEGEALFCAYEGRLEKKLSFYGKSISFSKRGWQNRMDHLKERENCCEYKHRLFEGEEWRSLFYELPIESTVMRTTINAGSTYVGDLVLLDYDGKKVWTKEDKSNLEALAKVLGYYLIVRKDIEKKEIEEKHIGRDALTGLYDLETFLNVAEEYVHGSEDDFALIYVDIGNFKSINRDYGYDAGDQVLRECARFLKESVPDVECVGRIYGDKFAVLCRKKRGLNNDEMLENAYHINNVMQKQIRQICADGNIMVHTGMFNLVPDVEMNVALSRAKLAKNLAKQQWTNRLIIFEDWMNDSVQRNYKLIGNVDDAIANREFQVYLQPKVNSENTKIVGAEALIRWKKADGTMVFPDEFIPVFEQNGRIVDVDYYVYEEVFRYLKERLDAGKGVVPISMNVSRVHLRDNRFFDKINDLLDRYQVPCEYLEFELTENVYVEKLQEAMTFVENIRKKKIRVSIDDFGSGYSSLNVISSIPLDVLKLDKVFMKRGAELTRKDQAVISHLVKLAKDIELEVLCEGVETQVQADFVKTIGCNAWQGYYFAKPMPMDEFDKYLDKGIG